MRHILGTTTAAKVAAGALVLVCVGAGAFGVAQLGAEAFDPSAFLGERINQQGQPDFNAAFDVDHSEAEGEANMQADQEETPQPEQPDLQQVDASSWSQSEGSGSSALSVVDGLASGGTVLGGGSGEGGTPSDHPLTGPVINGNGNQDGPGGGNGGQGGNQGGGNQGGGDNPTPPQATDPDPRPSLPDDLYGNGSVEVKPFPHGGVAIDPSENEPSILFQAITENGLPEGKTPDELGMERLYYSMYLDDWKLLCATYFYVDVNGVLYRLEEYSENFTIGTFPKVLNSDTLAVDFFFRPNAETNEWQHITVEYPVHPCKVIAQGWDGEPIKTRYPPAGEKVYLGNVYAEMLPKTTATNSPLAQMFPGWSLTEGGASVGPDFVAQTKGRIALYPLPLVDVPTGFTVEVKNVYNENYHVYEDKQILTAYKSAGSRNCVIPEGVQGVDLDDALMPIQAEAIRIPASLQSGVDQLAAKRTYEVDAANRSYYISDRMLFDAESKAICGIPAQKSTVLVPRGTPSVAIPENNTIKYMELLDWVENVDVAMLNGANVVVPQELYINYLIAWRPFMVDNRFILKPGSFNGFYQDGAAYTDEGKTLAQVLIDTHGVFVVPEGVTKVAARAFEKSPDVDTVILPSTISTLEAQSVAGQGIKRVIFKGANPPDLMGDAFGTSLSAGLAYVKPEAYEAFKSAWSSVLGESATVEVLQQGTCEVRELNGYSVLDIETVLPQGSVSETILFKVPTGIGEFSSDSLAGVQVSEIAAATFSECGFLRQVDLPESLKTIGRKAFAGCFNLESVYSASTDNILIGEHAFDDCGALRFAAFHAQSGALDGLWVDVTDEKTLSTWIDGVFWMYVPSNAQYLDEQGGRAGDDFYNNDYGDFVLERQAGGSLLYGSYLEDGGVSQLTLLGATTNISGTISLRSNTEVLRASVFSDCKNLTSIDPESFENVWWIEDYAFARSGLRSFMFPEILDWSWFGAGVFDDCADLQELSFAEGWTSIIDPFFYNSDNLNIKNITLPSTVESVSYNVFEGAGAHALTFTSAVPPALMWEGDPWPFVFDVDAPDDLRITLAGDAVGHEQDYFAGWKHALIGKDSSEKLTQEDEKAAAELFCTWFGLEELPIAPEPDVTEATEGTTPSITPEQEPEIDASDTYSPDILTTSSSLPDRGIVREKE